MALQDCGPPFHPSPSTRDSARSANGPATSGPHRAALGPHGQVLTVALEQCRPYEGEWGSCRRLRQVVGQAVGCCPGTASKTQPKTPTLILPFMLCNCQAYLANHSVPSIPSHLANPTAIPWAHDTTHQQLTPSPPCQFDGLFRCCTSSQQLQHERAQRRPAPCDQLQQGWAPAMLYTMGSLGGHERASVAWSRGASLECLACGKGWAVTV